MRTLQTGVVPLALIVPGERTPCRLVQIAPGTRRHLSKASADQLASRTRLASPATRSGCGAATACTEIIGDSAIWASRSTKWHPSPMSRPPPSTGSCNPVLGRERAGVDAGGENLPRCRSKRRAHGLDERREATIEPDHEQPAADEHLLDLSELSASGFSTKTALPARSAATVSAASCPRSVAAVGAAPSFITDSARPRASSGTPFGDRQQVVGHELAGLRARRGRTCRGPCPRRAGGGRRAWWSRAAGYQRTPTAPRLRCVSDRSGQPAAPGELPAPRPRTDRARRPTPPAAPGRSASRRGCGAGCSR